MKKIYFLMPLFCYSSMLIAQVPEPTVLFMEPKHGNGTDQILSRTNVALNGKFTISIGTRSQTGDFASLCPGEKTKLVYIQYESNGYSVDLVKCYSDGFGLVQDLSTAEKLFYSNLNNDLQIRKEDVNGNTKWFKQYGGSAGESLRDMVQVEDGGFIALFESNSNDGDVGSHYGGQFTMDLWAIKVDSNGDKVWSIVLGGSNDERASCIVPMPGGGCYILGNTLSTDHDCTSNHGNSDVFITRLDSSGNKIWTQCLGGSGFDGTRLAEVSLWAVSDGKSGALIAASTNSPDGDVGGLIGKGDFWLLDIDSAGNVLWDNCFGGPTTDEFPRTICRATDGSIWLGGISSGTSGQVPASYGATDGYLVHADQQGNFLSAKVFGGPDVDEIKMLHPLDNGLVMVGGMYRAAGGTVPDTFAGGPLDAFDIFLARVAPWTTAVKNVPAINDRLVAYPNPADNLVYISAQGIDHIKSLSIHDIKGRRIFRSASLPLNGINISDWPAGIYEVRVRTDEGNFSTKLMIQ